MADMREYKEAVKEAVEKERREDKNWSWRIIAVNKSEAKIGWGYLDYIGGKDPFTVQIDENDGTPAVVGTLPTGRRIYCFVGPERWDDCKTIDGAVKSVIHSMAATAHCIY